MPADGRRAAFLIYRTALMLYAARFIWSFFFFGSGMLWAATAPALVLDVLLISCILSFRKVSRAAA